MKKNILVSLAAMALLLSACGSQGSSAAPASSSAAPAPTSSAAPAPTSEAEPETSVPAPQDLQPVTQTVTDQSANGETISWDAQDANKDASSGFTSKGKFSATGDYVEYVFVASMAMKARLFVEVENRKDNVWDREAQSGHQSIWYNWYDGDDWKYNVAVNGAAIDQGQMGNYEVNGEQIPMKELVYTDFLEEGASTLVAPWFEFNVKQGKNNLRIERNLGYSVNMKSFKVVGTKAA